MSGLGIKDGKKPLSEKRRPKIDLAEWSPIGNALEIPPELLKYAKKEGIEFRWLSKQIITKNSGFHNRGWKVFKIPEGLDIGVDSYHLGGSERRELSRGGVVLGYKPAEAAEYHRDILKEKALRMKGIPTKAKEDLKQMVKETRGGIELSEGYDEDDSGYKPIER